MKYVVLLAILALSTTFGCEQVPLPVLPDDVIGGMNTGPDAGDDGDMPMGGEIPMGGADAGGNTGEGGVEVVEPGALCPIPGRDPDSPTEVPDFGQATSVYDGAEIHLYWWETSGADGAGLQHCVVGTDGLFRGAAEAIEEGLAPDAVERVVSVRVRGLPWVAYGGGELPIRVFQAHRAEDTWVQLDGRDGWPHLVGAPLVVAAGRDLMVFGRLPADGDGPGQAAWVRLTEFDPPTLPQTDSALNLPEFDDVVAIRGGLLARSSTDGQCVFLGGTEATPLSTLYCRRALGGLLTDGERPLLWSRFDFDETPTRCRQNVGVSNPYTFDDTEETFYRVMAFEAEDHLRLPRYNGLQPLIGRRTLGLADDLSDMGQTELSLIAAGEWWSSPIDAGWRPQDDEEPTDCPGEIETGWPYPTTRAIATQRPPENGCPDEIGCQLGTLNALLFIFGESGPQLRYLPLVQRMPDGALYEVGTDPGCRPSPEICDGLDNDCDGQPDDEICCLGEEVFGVNFPENLPDVFSNSRAAAPTGPVEQWLITADEDGKAIWAFHRSRIPTPVTDEERAGDLVWDGFKQYVGNARAEIWKRSAEDARISIAEFGEGVFATPSGGRLAFLVRNAEGVLHLVWSHYLPVTAPIELPPSCQNPLAVGVLRSDQERESVYLACTDRFVRYYHNEARGHLTYYWGMDCPGGCDRTSQALGISASGQIDWATITQIPLAEDPVTNTGLVKWDNLFYLLLGHIDEDADPPVTAYQITVAKDDECDGPRFNDCVDHCAHPLESVHCEAQEPPIYTQLDEDDTGWRRCGERAVAVKRECCAVLVERTLSDPDVQNRGLAVEARRAEYVEQCVQDDSNAKKVTETPCPNGECADGRRCDDGYCRISCTQNPGICAARPGEHPLYCDTDESRNPTVCKERIYPEWLHDIWKDGHDEEFITDFGGCFADMKRAKQACCLEDDPGQLACLQPQSTPLSALLNDATEDARANYAHPVWLAPALTKDPAIRRIEAAADEVGGVPRFEIARTGLRDDEGTRTIRWDPISPGPAGLETVEFASMGRRIVAVDRTESETRFYFTDVRDQAITPSLWAVAPSHRVPYPVYGSTEDGALHQPTWSFVSGPNLSSRRAEANGFTYGDLDNTLVMLSPRHLVEGAAVPADGLGEGDLVIDGVEVEAASPDPVPDESRHVTQWLAEVINAKTNVSGVTAVPQPTDSEGNAMAVEGGRLDIENPLIINGQPVFPFDNDQGQTQNLEFDPWEDQALDGQDGQPDTRGRALEARINALFPDTGVIAALAEGESPNRLLLRAVDGRPITIETTEEAARITGLAAGVTSSGGIQLNSVRPFTVGGANPGAAGLVAGESQLDPSRWRISARRVECGE